MELTQNIEENQGESPLKFIIHDEQSGTFMNMPSRSYKVKISKNFLTQLNQIGVKEYKLN